MTPGAGNLRQLNEADHWKFYKQAHEGTDISFGRVSHLFFTTNWEERISKQN